MSRSCKKNSFIGVCAVSDKHDKRLASKRDRRINKFILRKTFDESFLRPKRETSSVWDMAKDGKIRFDSVECPSLMRK